MRTGHCDPLSSSVEWKSCRLPYEYADTIRRPPRHTRLAISAYICVRLLSLDRCPHGAHELTVARLRGQLQQDLLVAVRHHFARHAGRGGRYARPSSEQCSKVTERPDGEKLRTRKGQRGDRSHALVPALSLTCTCARHDVKQTTQVLSGNASARSMAKHISAFARVPVFSCGDGSRALAVVQRIVDDMQILDGNNVPICLLHIL
jgi:hypothetical protein